MYSFDTFEKAIIALVLMFVVPLISFSLYAMLVVMPVYFYNDAECLRQGYPSSSVSIGLERYCMTTDGVVSVTVKHQ